MLRIGDVKLQTNLLLAPIAGHCDLAFRLTAREITGPSGGLGLAFTDLLCPQALLSENDKSLWLAATCPEDRLLGMQLYGADGAIMAEAAQWAEAHGAALVDINMGCPVDKVTKRNGGAKLLCDPAAAVRLARQVVQAVRVPVTTKLRLGWDGQRLVAAELAVALAEVGVKAITVHGRTAEQRFTGQASLEGIAAVVRAMRARPEIPVIGNGDVKSPADARRMLEVTGCAGVMIGRGALGQPWVFRDTAHYLATGEVPPPLAQADRARIVLRHFEHLLGRRKLHEPPPGSRPFSPEKIAVNMIRQRISWYSPHLQPWPGLRREMQELDSVAAVREYLLRGIERSERGEEPGYATARRHAWKNSGTSRQDAAGRGS